MGFKLIASTAVVAALVSTSTAFADTEATRGSVSCYNALVLTKDVAHNSITLAGGLTISGELPNVGLVSTDLAHTAIASGDSLQICFDLLKEEDATHGLYAAIINDITAQMDVAGYFTIATPSKNV